MFNLTAEELLEVRAANLADTFTNLLKAEAAEHGLDLLALRALVLEQV